MSQPDADTDPRLAQAIARAERRREMLEQLANMGMALAKEMSARFIEGPQRPEARRDPARSFGAISRAVRLTLMLEARVEKQILAWRKDGVVAEALAPEPFLRPWTDSAVARRERVREAVSLVIDKEAGDPDEARWMRDRVARELIEAETLDDHRLMGGFRDCVEAICADLGLEPDWSDWHDEEGFTAPIPPPPARATGEELNSPPPHPRE